MKHHIRRKMITCFFSLALVLSAFSSAPGVGHAATDAVGAASNACPITAVCGEAPHITPTVANGEKILFDNTHGETAGAADWVINGGFSDFAGGLADNGYEIQELRQTTPITYANLKDYDVFVVPESNVPYKQSEQAAMIQYVENGGSIFFIADHYNADRNKNRWDASEVFNGYRRGAFNNPTKGMATEEANSEAMQGVVSSDWLATNFGVRFRYNAIGDINATNIVAPIDTFGITMGVQSVAMHSGSTLQIIDPTHAKGLVYLPENPPAWGPAVDQGVYDNGGIAEGPMVAISKLGKGKAAFIGDSSPIEDSTPVYVREDNGDKKVTYDGFKEADDGTLLVNLVKWLSTQEDYTSFYESGITLDSPTAIHDFEIPANTTEPEPEPWAAPDPGYKWWDSSTFKRGSYGSSELAVDPTYSFVHQDPLPAGDQVFKIRVQGDKLGPFSSSDNLKVAIYLPGGQQVAKFSFDSNSWPTSYGYSDLFTLNANSNGHAEKDLYVRIDPSVTGQANLRIKQGSKNVVTESVIIANVVPEPLPPGEGEETPDAISIASARAQTDGSLATVQGTVTSEPGLYGGQGFYLQDATGGIYVFQNDTGIHVGDELTVTARLDTYHTERELGNPKIVKTGQGDVPSPQVVSALSDGNQGQLVELKNVTITNLQEDTGAFVFDAVNGQGSTFVRVDSRTGVEKNQFSNGEVVDLIGESTIWDGTFQLKPRTLADFYGGVLPINIVRTLGANQVVTIEGVATTDSGLWGSKGFYIQSANGGLYVFQSDVNVSQGDKVKVTGTTAIFNGEFEVDATKVEKVGSTAVPVPVVVSPDGVNDHNQGELIKLSKVTVTNIHKVDNFGTSEMTATKDGKSVVIRLDNRTGTTTSDFLNKYKDGDVLNVVGVSSVFKGTYQVKPRSITDFELADITAPVTTAEVSGVHLSDGSYLEKATLTLSAKDDGSGVAKTEYKLNDGEWITYSGPITVTAYDTTTVNYRSTDNAGNIENTKSLGVNVITLTYDNLYTLIDKAAINPEGQKTALKAHLQSAERAKTAEDEAKQLENALKFVNNMSAKHISDASKQDIELFIKAIQK